MKATTTSGNARLHRNYNQFPSWPFFNEIDASSLLTHAQEVDLACRIDLSRRKLRDLLLTCGVHPVDDIEICRYPFETLFSTLEDSCRDVDELQKRIEESRASGAPSSQRYPLIIARRQILMRFRSTPTSLRNLVVEARKTYDEYQRARHMLANCNLRLVASIAKKRRVRGLPLEDRVQAGVIGLMRAVDKFDFQRGCRFSTYATPWIRQAISRACGNNNVIRTPTNSVRELYAAMCKLEQEYGRAPTLDELAAFLQKKPDRIRRLYQAMQFATSLDQPGGSDDADSLAKKVQDNRFGNPSDALQAKELHSRIFEALNQLTIRERVVLTLRYGLDGLPSRTLKEIGDMYGVSRERVRQIIEQALKRLRELPSGKRLFGFLD